MLQEAVDALIDTEEEEGLSLEQIIERLSLLVTLLKGNKEDLDRIFLGSVLTTQEDP